MATIIPRPPGYAVEFTQPPAARFAEAGPDNSFIVGFFDRGTVAQAADVAGLDAKLGGRVNYSVARDDAATQLAEGVRALTAARVTGSGARAASVTFTDGGDPADDAIVVEAGSVGDWGNGLEVEIVDATAGAVQIVVTENDVPVATSPSTTDVAELVAWDSDGIVRVSGSLLPAVTAARPLTGGDDDRANVRPSDYAAAMALLDRRYGPGALRAPGVTDRAVHALLLEHGRTHNRKVFLDLPQGISKADALAYVQALLADLPDDDELIGGAFASWAYTRPIGSEPERLVPWGAVQAGIAARVHRELGVGVPPFGVTNGAALTVTRLADEWSDDDRHDLYVAGINVATDDGTTFATWGYRTLSPDPLNDDLHHRHVRMVLKWQAEAIAKRYVGPPITPATQADFAGELEALCQDFVRAQALAAFIVDLDSVNDDDTAAARQRHAVMYVRHTETSDWVTVTIPILPTS